MITKREVTKAQLLDAWLKQVEASAPVSTVPVIAETPIPVNPPINGIRDEDLPVTYEGIWAIRSSEIFCRAVCHFLAVRPSSRQRLGWG